MKNIVINEHYAQADLKPSALLDEYVSLLSADVRTLLASGKLVACACPACSSKNTEKSFDKLSLSYQSCKDCGTVYVSPRPNDGAIMEFFAKAPSKVFWREKLSEVSRQSRKAKIIKPRMEWIMDSTAEYVPKAAHWADIHTAQERYLEAMASSQFKEKTLIAPYCHVKTPEAFSVVAGPLEAVALKKAADVITLFEVLDHAADPSLLLSFVHKNLTSGGLCFITCILSSGMDVRELGARAKNIYPPDRLNVFSANGLQDLSARHGFECLEFSTPGILDVDIVAAALKEDPSVPVSPFIKDLVLNASADVRGNFQEFLQANMLSSYGRVLLRKV